MKRLLKQFRYGEKGFTLIELLIVVAILGILAAVVLPNVGKMMGGATLNAANTEVASVKTAATAYMADHNGTWPETSADLADYLSGGVLKGTYTFDSTGLITNADPVPGGWQDVSWDSATQLWEKSSP